MVRVYLNGQVTKEKAMFMRANGIKIKFQVMELINGKVGKNILDNL